VFFYNIPKAVSLNTTNQINSTIIESVPNKNWKMAFWKWRKFKIPTVSTSIINRSVANRKTSVVFGYSTMLQAVFELFMCWIDSLGLFRWDMGLAFFNCKKAFSAER
jgi:hypothetical protein